jgi:hypothetical protein
VIVLLAQPRWWMVFPVPSLLFEFSQSAFWLQYTSAFHLSVFNFVS